MTARKSSTAKKLAVVSPPEEEEQAPQWQNGNEVTSQRIQWLLPGRIVAGAVNILEGEKGVLKSTFSSLLSSMVSAGSKLLGRKKTKPGAVIWLPGEEDVTTVVRPRLEAAGADLSRVIFPPVDAHGSRWRPCFPADLDTLATVIDQYSAKLCVIDPLSSYIPAGCDLRNDQQIHEVLDPLSDLAAQSGCTFLLNRNLSKNVYADALNRGLGGAAVAGVARSVLRIDWPDRSTSRRVLRVVACNLAPNTPALEFTVESAGDFGICQGFKELDPTAESEAHPDDDLAERDVRGDAKTLLRKLLDKGPCDAKTIFEEAMTIQVSPRTLRTAKAEMKIGSRRIGNRTPAKWQWLPPKGGFPKGGVQK